MCNSAPADVHFFFSWIKAVPKNSAFVYRFSHDEPEDRFSHAEPDDRFSHDELCESIFLLDTLCFNPPTLSPYRNWHKTLTPFQSHACDGEELHLQCTSNTIISVHYVFYGSQKNTDHLCPGSTSSRHEFCESKKALKVILDRCHKHQICRLSISPDTFKDDICRGVRKYIEVMYKCRPDQFLNKVICEGDQLNLNCPSGYGLTIISAAFGTTKSGVAECRQPDGVELKDCFIDHADETLRSLCSGRQNCSLKANVKTFGNPDCIGKKFLKVAYNCVEKKFLLPVNRISEDTIHTTSYPAWAVGVDQSFPKDFGPREYGLRETPLPSDSSKVEMQSDEVPTDNKKETLSRNQELVGFMSKWMSAHKYMKGNKDKLILYISVSLGVGIVVFATILVARYVIIRLESKQNSNCKISPETEDQFFSDSDLEQYDPPEEILPPPMPNYMASMKRHGSDALPRAPIDNGVEHNHYFS